MAVVMDSMDTTTDIINNHTRDININIMIPKNHNCDSSITLNFNNLL